MDEIQVASYKMLASLYTLGTDPTLTHDRKYLKTEIERHKPALGSCLGAFGSTFPVAYLEPHLNKHNQYSLLNRIADHSLEAQGMLLQILLIIWYLYLTLCRYYDQNGELNANLGNYPGRSGSVCGK